METLKPTAIIDPKNLPTSIVAIVKVQIKNPKGGRYTHCFLGDNDVLYFTSAYSQHLGLAAHTLTQRIRKFGYDCDGILGRYLPRRITSTSGNAAWKALSGRARTHNLSKIRVGGSLEHLIKCPPAAHGMTAKLASLA